MKMYVIQNVETKEYVRRVKAAGYKSTVQTKFLWEATLFRQRNHASCTSEIQFKKDKYAVVEVEVRVSKKAS